VEMVVIGGNGGNRWKWWKGLETVEKNKVTHFHVSTNLIWQATFPGGANPCSLCTAGWIEGGCQEVPLRDSDLAATGRVAGVRARARPSPWPGSNLGNETVYPWVGVGLF
jgi:hypothetical protein